MHRLFLILLLLIGLSSKGMSQFIDTVYPEWKYLYGVHELDDTSFVLLRDDARIFNINHSGKIKWTSKPYDHLKAPGTSFTTYPTDSTKLIYVVTLEDDCDVFYDYKVHTFNVNGDEIETELFDQLYLPLNRFVFPQLPGLPKYLLGAGELLLYYRQDSVVTIPGHHFISTFNINTDGDFCVFGIDSIFKYEFHHDSLVLIASVAHNLTYAFDLFMTDDSKVIVGSNQIIRFFDQHLEFIKDFYTLPGEKISNFYWHDPFLIARIALNSTVNKYYIFDSNLNLQFTSTLSIRDFQTSDMIWKEDSTLTIAGSEFYRDDKFYAFVKTFDYSSAAITHNQNIAISGIRFDNVIVGGVGECYYSDTTRSFLIKNCTVQLTNHGTDVVNNVSITPPKTFCSWWCDRQQQYFHELTEMDLPPGQTKNYFIGDVPIEREDQNLSDHQLCLLAILPDDHIDIDHSDNMYCFDLTTAIDNSTQEKVVILYPNPAKDILHFSSSDRINFLTISNIEGKTVMRLKEIEMSQINVSQLTPGVYHIQFEYDNGYISSDRFIKI
ncbi:MAG: T9SS type A sorting domain-containing protein [Saprospiraceae bacterium]